MPYTNCNQPDMNNNNNNLNSLLLLFPRILHITYLLGTIAVYHMFLIAETQAINIF